MKKILTFITMILFLIIMLLVLTGCTNKENQINEDIKNKNDVVNDNTLKSNNDNEQRELKVGEYTLKYGKYIGDSYEYGTAGFDEDDSVSLFTIIYTLNSDGTYTYSSTSGEIEKGTYTVIDLSTIDMYFNEKSGIEFSNGTILAVPDNNTLQVMAGAMETFIYQEN